MPPRSLRDQHPREADRLAVLLRQLRETSGIPQKELAPRLAVSESALSRYLTGQAVMPKQSLEAFLELTGASPAQRDQTRTLMGIITGEIQPPTPPLAPAQPTVPSHNAGKQHEPRTSQTVEQGLLAKVLRKVPLVATVMILPCLWVAGSADGRREVPPASSTAWSEPLPDGRAGFYSHAVFYRKDARLVIFDDAPDGRSAIVDVKINGKQAFRPVYHSGGRTDASHPPLTIKLSDYGFGPTDTIEYRACAGEAKDRGEPLKFCGNWKTDPPDTATQAQPGPATDSPTPPSVPPSGLPDAVAKAPDNRAKAEFYRAANQIKLYDTRTDGQTSVVVVKIDGQVKPPVHNPNGQYNKSHTELNPPMTIDLAQRYGPYTTLEFRACATASPYDFDGSDGCGRWTPAVAPR